MGVKYKKNRIKSRICWAIALVLAAAMLGHLGPSVHFYGTEFL